MKSSVEIRRALIQIAEKNGRPHYSLAVVRDVIDAFKSGKDHHLKSDVIAENVSLVAENEKRDERLDDLVVFCGRTGMRRILSETSGVNHTALSSILNGSRSMTAAMWERLSSSFDAAERAYKHSRNTRKVRR